MTTLDRRRRERVAAALALGEPARLAEAKVHLEQMRDAVAALDALDDLGSPEARERAFDDLVALERRVAALADRVRSWPAETAEAVEQR